MDGEVGCLPKLRHPLGRAQQPGGGSPGGRQSARKGEGALCSGSDMGTPFLLCWFLADFWWPPASHWACLPMWPQDSPQPLAPPGLSGKDTLTCFIRSKSKASRATSFTLPTGFTLGTVWQMQYSGLWVGRRPQRWGPGVGRRPGQGLPSQG